LNDQFQNNIYASASEIFQQIVALGNYQQGRFKNKVLKCPNTISTKF